MTNDDRDDLGVRLSGEFDASVWAREWNKAFPVYRPSEETMLGWFANAIMSGYDHARRTEDTSAVLSPTALDDLTTDGDFASREMKPFAFSYTDGQGSYCDNPDEGRLTLEEAVFQALGYASMCWSEIPTGIFESDRCKEAGDALIAFIEDMM